MNRENNIIDEIKSYAELKGNEIKLRTVKGLSISVSAILSAILIIGVLQLVLIALAVALVLLIGNICGNYMLGAFIAVGIFALLLGILILCRKKLFTGTMVRTFIKLLFPEEYENS